MDKKRKIALIIMIVFTIFIISNISTAIIIKNKYKSSSDITEKIDKLIDGENISLLELKEDIEFINSVCFDDEGDKN